MNPSEIVIRKTPFLFLKRVAALIFFFALLPAFVAALAFEEIDGKTICVLSVSPAGVPVYLTFKGKEDFYIRTGNSSQPLPVSKATKYVQTRFGG